MKILHRPPLPGGDKTPKIIAFGNDPMPEGKFAQIERKFITLFDANEELTIIIGGPWVPKAYKHSDLIPQDTPETTEVTGGGIITYKCIISDGGNQSWGAFVHDYSGDYGSPDHRLLSAENLQKLTNHLMMRTNIEWCWEGKPEQPNC